MDKRKKENPMNAAKKMMAAVKEIEESLGMTWAEAVQTYTTAYQLMVATDIIIRTMGSED